jgi:hypothetical protein
VTRYSKCYIFFVETVNQISVLKPKFFTSLVNCVSQLRLVPNYECYLKTCVNQTLTCDSKLFTFFFCRRWAVTSDSKLCVCIFCRLCQPVTYDSKHCTLFVACVHMTVKSDYKFNVFYLQALSTGQRPVNSNCILHVQACHTDSDLLYPNLFFFCSNSTTLTCAKPVHF